MGRVWKRIELTALPPSKVEYIELAIGSVLTFKRLRNPHRLLNVWIGR
jgi:hypothetical protein